MDRKKVLFWVALAFIALATLLFVWQELEIRHLRKEKSELEAILATFPAKPDTLVIRDTIRVPRPKETAKPRPTHDTLFVPVTDTLLLARTDTLYLPLPREQREYGDSTYRAWVSGVSPRLDSILVFPTNTIITKPTPVLQKQKWGVGLQGGVGAVQPFKGDFDPKVGYYLGIGINYNF